MPIQNVLAIPSPKEKANAAISVMGNHLIVIGAYRPHPNVQHVVHRREIGDGLAIRRDLGRGFAGIAKQHLARD
ncbi:MAG: hypothetical protein HC853_09540 [Anaerolineae bacterium]|nr:hypothetical protein [Anaerolineae bacterium]